jgi:hypothetical protein
MSLDEKLAPRVVDLRARSQFKANAARVGSVLTEIQSANPTCNRIGQALASDKARKVEHEGEDDSPKSRGVIPIFCPAA